MTRLFALLVITGLLVGCSSKKNHNPQLVASPDKVTAMLANAADKAAEALETLAAVEQSRSPGIAVAPIENAPVALQRSMTVNWIGPVEPIAKKLADRASYNFRIIGTPPPVPLVVSLDAENTPIIDSLRSLGLQLGMRADIKVDAKRHVVELHYAPNTGVGGGQT